MVLSIPEEATRVVVLIRHSKAEKEGPDDQKRLSKEGKELCRRVRPTYLELVSQLEIRFSAPALCNSAPFVRAVETNLKIFERGARIREELRLIASLTKIGGGAWFKKQQEKGVSLQKMIQTGITDEKLHGGQPWDEARTKYLGFLCYGTKKDKVVVATCHEPHISQVGLNHFPLEELGLLECEALIFYCRGDAVVGAEKFVPSLT